MTTSIPADPGAIKEEEGTGYQHRTYAESLVEFGTPLLLPASRGWILKRPIPGTPYQDAMGCYPVFACRNWSKLQADLEGIGGDLVSLALVTDPFGEYDPGDLHQCFQDVVHPFKEHFVADLRQPMNDFISSNHRYKARRALRSVSVELCEDPPRFIDNWVSLYQSLKARHRIIGISAFTKTSFERQLHVPGIVAFRAVHKDVTVGMTLWYLQGEVGYYHLGAYSSLGYELRASFALFWYGIASFADQGLRWLNLGAGAGVKGDNSDGLTRFKRGWSNGTRTTYFCGRIFDRNKYQETTRTKGISPADYFPAYRKGEFL